MTQGWWMFIVSVTSVVFAAAGFLYSRLRDARRGGQEEGRAARELLELRELVASVKDSFKAFRTKTEDELRPLANVVNDHTHRFDLHEERLSNFQANLGKSIDTVTSVAAGHSSRLVSNGDRITQNREDIIELRAAQKAGDK